jgi:hypothetical protein
LAFARMAAMKRPGLEWGDLPHLIRPPDDRAAIS